MTGMPKYALGEIERRWLVHLERVGSLLGLPFCTIEDLYITDTRLRLRRVERGDGEVIHKLGKKYGRQGRWCEPATNLYLTREEYCVFASLAGAKASKARYSLAGGSLDVYASPERGLAIFETEFETVEAAGLYRPPEFVTKEITGEARFSGAAIASVAPLPGAALRPGSE